MMRGKLFPRLAFSPDETHTSWAGRLAEFHTGDGVRKFLNDMQIPGMAFFYGHAEFVQQLCYIADQDPAPVLKNTIFRTSRNQCSLGNETFGSNMLMGKITKFCPACLLEDEAQGERPHAHRRERVSWRFRSTLVCPIHHIYLISDNVISDSTAEMSSRVPLNAEGLQILADHGRAAKPSKIQSYVLRRIAGRRGPVWLDGQRIDQATRATEMLGAVIQFGFDAEIESMSIKESHRAADVGWKWTSKGEAGLRQAFARLQAIEPRSGVPRDLHPGYKFGKLYQWLSQTTAQDDRGPIRTVLREHICRTEPITTDQSILGVMVKKNHIQRQKRGNKARA